RYGPHTLSGDDPTRYRSKETDELWQKRDPLIRMRNYLTDKGLWSKDKEDALIEKVKDEIKDAINKADKAPQQTVSRFLKDTYEVAPQNVAEQLAEFQGKESK
ncbi:MAG: thiamine pyrophosphate-dependent enzyme, partial [Citrobacter freundii]|nr:thiamine pyrophosphate-dependent enzyme [Citrobacter freundii]